MSQGVDLSHLAASQDGAAAEGPSSKQVSNGFVFDATDESFQEVSELSKQVPVVVDLWAEWCAPCKTLGPILERVTQSFEGRVALAKVDVDSNPGLARAFNAQSIPTVVALVAGQPVPLFQGALPEEQVKQYFEKLLELAAEHGVKSRLDGSEETEPAEPEVNPLHEAALTALETGDYDTAIAEYQKVVTNHPADEVARVQLYRSKLLQRLSGKSAAEIRAAAAAAPNDIESGLLAADLDTSGGHVEDAFLRVLDLFESAEADQKTRIREHLLELFEIVGLSDSRVAAARMRLANMLF